MLTSSFENINIYRHRHTCISFYYHPIFWETVVIASSGFVSKCSVMFANTKAFEKKNGKMGKNEKIFETNTINYEEIEILRQSFSKRLICCPIMYDRINEMEHKHQITTLKSQKMLRKQNKW